jgi:large conductance mechanosensitive channel
MGFIKEFREFALKGNVIDLAVGVIIGGAFGRIINSLIADVIMPVVSIPGKADFSNLYVGLNESARAGIAAYSAANNGNIPPIAEARGMGAIFAYGSFITEVINFVILAFCIFLVIKAINTARRKFEKQAEAAPPPPPAADIVLLTEIRDLLRTQR